MANRRMFSKSVINSARFLRMPQTSRLLFYDLGMQADDDGVVEAFTVMRTTGASEDDLKVLEAKGFIKILNEDLVSYITDWNTNNCIRKERYNPGAYHDLLAEIAECQQDNFSLPDGQPNVTQMDTTCQPNVTQNTPQYRLGKDSVDKGSVEQYSIGEDSSGKKNNGKNVDKGASLDNDNLSESALPEKKAPTSYTPPPPLTSGMDDLIKEIEARRQRGSQNGN